MREHALFAAIVVEIVALSATGILAGHGVIDQATVQLVAVACILMVVAAYAITRRASDSGAEVEA